jgi:hypothetical protein
MDLETDHLTEEFNKLKEKFELKLTEVITNKLVTYPQGFEFPTVSLCMSAREGDYTNEVSEQGELLVYDSLNHINEEPNIPLDLYPELIKSIEGV